MIAFSPFRRGRDPAIYLLGRHLLNSRVALTAAALLCVNSYHIHYSQEARSYSLTMFLCILSSLYFIKLLAEPSHRNRAAYILLSALAVYAHFFSGLMLLAHWLAHWSFAPIPGRKVHMSGMVTLRPEGGLPLKLARRS